MKSKKPKTFVELCLDGSIDEDEIENYVDRWHEGGSGMDLHEYLGFTLEDYALWAEQPDSLRYILYSKKNGVPLEAVLNNNDTVELAARGFDPRQAREIAEWIEMKKKLMSERRSRG